MVKKCILVIILAICAAVLSACAATPAPAPAATASQTASPVKTEAATISPAPAPSATESVLPSASESSASADASASGTDDLGITLENIIKEDSLNKNYQSSMMKVPGEDIKATIEGNTLTFNVTLDKNIKPADFTDDMKAKYTKDLQNQINILAGQYDGLIDCTFIYNLMSKDGTKLMTLTQDYKEP